MNVTFGQLYLLAIPIIGRMLAGLIHPTQVREFMDLWQKADTVIREEFEIKEDNPILLSSNDRLLGPKGQAAYQQIVNWYSETFPQKLGDSAPWS